MNTDRSGQEREADGLVGATHLPQFFRTRYRWDGSELGDGTTASQAPLFSSNTTRVGQTSRFRTTQVLCASTLSATRRLRTLLTEAEWKWYEPRPNAN